MSLKYFLAENPSAISIIQRRQSQTPVDVVKLANDFKINVWEESRPESFSGKLFLDEEHGGDSGFSIAVRSDDPLVRKRFTVAHEIAHFLLHKKLIGSEVEDNALYRSSLSDKVEHEANKLAAEILMPVSLVQEALSVNSEIREIASQLQVSEVALKIRLGIPT